MNADPDLTEDYILSHISPEPPELTALYRHTYLHCLYPRMCSGHLQGRILKMLAAMASPRRVLELGAFTGYSALCLAEGMPQGSELHTVEIDDEKAGALRELFAANPRPASITLHTADALQAIEELPGGWDMVYVDADKRHYADYMAAVLPRLNPGGFILADNTLWDGHAADPSRADAQTLGIRRFNDAVAADPTLEKVILPLRDGLTIIRKKTDSTDC